MYTLSSMWMIYSFFSQLLLIIFPSSCFLCHKEGDALCVPCLRNLQKSIDSPFQFIKSVYSFKDHRVKRIIHAFKYYHRKDLVYPLAQELVSYIPENLHDKHYTIIPIPMPKIRMYMRGYNQAEVLALALAEITKQSFHKNILIRVKTKKRQVLAQTRSLRLHNQKGAFGVASSVQGMDILLVDDVTTTGATLSEARKLLLEHGAHTVYALTIAH